MPKKHKQYTVDNETVPSVTTVLGVISHPGLAFWYGKHGIEKAEGLKKEAGVYGDQVHTLAEKVFTEAQVKVPQLHMTSIKNLIAWSNKYVKRWVCWEQAVYSKKHKYAGTMDAIAELKDGTFVLVDLKTSNHYSHNYDLQVNAYKFADYCEDPTVDLTLLSYAIILHLDKTTGSWSQHIVSFTTQTFDVFLAALVLYNWQKTHESKR